MKHFFLFIVISISFRAFAQKPTPFLSYGLDYRMYPIDIENAPRGPLPSDNGLPADDSKFWKVLSIHGRYGFILEQNWLLSASLYSRYNLLHRVQGINYYSPSPTVLEPSDRKVKERKNLKLDFFIDAEKKMKLKKNKERYFFALAGIGFTNINSRFAIVLTDSVESIPFDSRHYKGTLFHFSPRISLGYQYNKLKASLDAYIIEDPTLANLTSLWIGATISYEMLLKKKKK